MVTFTSLFLWLMTGIHPVHVAVDPAVVSVEIFLDGESIGFATKPQWEVKCDFGPQLRPHELVAVARDAANRELGRAVQVVNLPRADAEVEIVFEGESAEKPTMLRVITESDERLEPLAIFATFDGRALEREVDGRFRLPPFDRQQVHIITAEAHFPDAVTARRDVTFGGTRRGQVTTDLTAVPVTLDTRRELDGADVHGLLRARGEVLKVAAVDRQGARIYVVRDHGAWSSLWDSGLELDRNREAARQSWLFSKEVAAWVSRDPEKVKDIDPMRDRLYLTVPNPTRSRGLAIYPVSQPFDIKRWGLPWLMTHIVAPQAAVRGQQLATAVTIAAVRAAGGGSPRAVVLVLGDDAVDDSDYRPQEVRDYVRALRVPLVVWSTTRGAKTSEWGEVEKVAGMDNLRKASRRLLKRLHRQWIVWVEGRHLPYEIELADNELGVRLAG
jgi:hypothetical protein